MRFFGIIIFYIICIAGFAQKADTLSSIKPEHISLSYDKPNGCYLGDTVHFTVSLDSCAPSRVVYVDLLHPKGKTIISRKLKLDSNLSATGTLPLDTLYGSGFYEIRAYTRFSANFTPRIYPHFILPVFRPEEQLGKKKEDKVRYINTKVYQNYRYSDSESSRNPVEVYFNAIQPVEDQLLVFGQVAEKLNIVTRDEDAFYNKHFHIAVLQDKKGITGEAFTDSSGYFAVKLPDSLKGDWNLLMYEKQTGQKGVFATDELRRFRVLYREDFKPKRFRYREEDYNPTNFGFRKWKEDKSEDGVTSYFYNCDAFAIKNQIDGLVPQGLYAWLGKTDSYFSGTMGVASPTVMNVAPDTTYNRFLDINFPNGNDSNDPRTVCINGPTYQGRPIVWIVNGEYRMVTGLNKRIKDFKVLRPSHRHIPQYIDEICTVFMNDAPRAFHSYLRCSVLEKKKPITIFITTHEGYIWNDSALMTGHFRGYDN